MLDADRGQANLAKISQISTRSLLGNGWPLAGHCVKHYIYVVLSSVRSWLYVACASSRLAYIGLL